MKTLVNNSKEIIAISLLLFIVLITNKINAEVPAGGNNNLLGYVYYQNEIPTAVPSSVVSIYNAQGLQVATTTSNQEGYYSFTALPDGTYTLTVQPSIPWGGANATDAHLILQHFVQSSILDGLKVQAADAFKGGTVNAKDALAVARRFVGLDNSFSQGDFVKENMTVSLNGNVNMIHNIQILATGDVNASYDFSGLLKKEAGVVMQASPEVSMQNGISSELALATTQSFTAGAISLVFEYPHDQILIESVSPVTDQGFFTWHAENGSLRMAWFNASPVLFESGTEFFRIRVNPIGKGSISNVLTPAVETEFSGTTDALGTPLTLSFPKIRIIKPLLSESLSLYPNPIKTYCNVSFTTERTGPALLKVRNLLGEILFEQSLELNPGANQFTIPTEDFPKGIYLVDIQQGAQKLATRKLTKS